MTRIVAKPAIDHAGGGAADGSLVSGRSATPQLSDTIVIAPEGEVDSARLNEFRHTVYDAARRAEQLLVVDLSRVESIESSGPSALAELHHRLWRHKRGARRGSRHTRPRLLLAARPD